MALQRLTVDRFRGGELIMQSKWPTELVNWQLLSRLTAQAFPRPENIQSKD
jgi:hypothetical protein